MAAPPPLSYTDGAGASLDLPLLALYSSHAGNAQNSDLYVAKTPICILIKKPGQDPATYISFIICRQRNS